MTTAGTFVQTIPGHKWHRIEHGKAVCGASLANGEWDTTGIKVSWMVCDDCTDIDGARYRALVSVICEDDNCPHIVMPHSHA